MDSTAPTEPSGTCQYTHDVTDERFDDLPMEVWECPHPTPEDEAACPFHRGRPEYDQQDRERPALGTLFQERVADGAAATNRFLGAAFGTLDLDYAVIEGPTNHPIDCRDASFERLALGDATVAQPLLLDGIAVDGDLTLDRSEFGGQVRLVDARIAGEASFEDATFARRFDIGGAHFEGHCSLRLARFESWMDMRDARLEATSYYRNARFARGVYGVGASFGGLADFLNSTFDKVGNFKQATFERGANFGSVDAANSLDLRRATLSGPFEPERGGASGSVRPKRRDFDGAGWFDGMVVGKDVRFTDATLDGDLRLRDVEISGALDLDPAGVTGDTDGTVLIDCQEAAVSAGRIDPPSGEVRVDLREATLGDVVLDGPDPFSRTRVLDTTFDGFDFGRRPHRDSLAARSYRLAPRDDDGDPVRRADLENTYLKAKNGATRVGASKAAAEFFRREMGARRAGHRSRAADSGRPAAARLLAAGRYVANGALAATAGYGERPSRTLLSSVGVVALFGALFLAVFEARTGRFDLGFAALYSFQSFIAFLVGSPPAADRLVQALSALEGFVGAFLIALFVFTLTRSVHR